MIYTLVQLLWLIFSLYLSGYLVLTVLVGNKKLNNPLTLVFSFILGNLELFLLSLILLCFSKLDLVVILWQLVAIASCLALIYLKRKSLLKGRVLPKLSDIVIFLVIVCISAPLLLTTLLSPLNSWDSKGIWLFKAESFYLSNDLGTNAIYTNPSFDYAHRDYPIAFPLIISVNYRFAGSNDENFSKIYLLSFLVNLIILIFGFVKYLFKKHANLISVSVIICLIFSGEILTHAASGYADFPLAFAFAAALAAFIISLKSERLKDKISYSILSLMAGIFAANIKNEGLSFLLILTLGILIQSAVLIFKNKSLFKQITNNKNFIIKIILALIFLATLVIWFFIKNKMNFGTDLFLQQTHFTLSDYYHRLIKIVKTIWSQFTNFQTWGWNLILLSVAFIAELFILISRVGKNYKILNFLPALIIIGQALAYIFVYLNTPFDLDWHLATTIDRLILHLFPTLFLLVLFYFKEIFIKDKNYE